MSFHLGKWGVPTLRVPAIDVERKFINALAKTDHYYVKEDTLSLTAGQFRILVKFVATR